MRPWRLRCGKGTGRARVCRRPAFYACVLMHAATASERSQANLVQENHTGSICNQSSISSHCTLCGTLYTWTCGDSSSRHRMPVLGVSSLDFRPLSSGLLFTPGAFCNLRSRGKVSGTVLYRSSMSLGLVQVSGKCPPVLDALSPRDFALSAYPRVRTHFFPAVRSREQTRSAASRERGPTLTR